MSKIIRTSLLATVALGSVLALGGDALLPLEGTARADQADIGLTLQIPQILTFGGPVVAAPRIVPVFFAGDPMAATLTDFLHKLAADPTYASSLREYGVGRAAIATPVTLSDTPPAQITSTQIGPWLAGKLADPSFPPPDANTMYVLVYPDGTELDQDFGFGFTLDVCLLSGGVHNVATAPSGAPAPFVAAARCDGLFGQTGADEVTAPLSLLLAGALTDPRPDAPAYDYPDFGASAWGYATGVTEIGETCAYFSGGVGKSASIGYAVSRIWSNRAALAQRDPCRGPGADEHYFNAAPVYLDGIEPTPYFFIKGLPVAEGGEVTIPIRLFGDDGAPRSWSLSATESIADFGSFDPYGLLSFSFDRDTGGSGDIRHLTVKRAPLPPGASPPPLLFQIDSTADGRKHSWVVVVADGG